MNTYLTLRQRYQNIVNFMALPTTKEESWRFSKLDSYLDKPFLVEVKKHWKGRFPYQKTAQLDFENARLIGQNLPENIILTSGKLSFKEPAFIDNLNHFENDYTLTCSEKATLVTKNSFAAQGLYTQKRKIHLLKDAKMTFVDIVESDSDTFISSHTLFQVDAGASLRHIKIMLLPQSAAMVTYTDLLLEKKASAALNLFYHGGGMTQEFYNSHLKTSSTLNLNALIFGDDHNETTLVSHCHHHESQSQSSQRSKQVLKNFSKAVFDSTVTVDRGTKACDVKQKSASLLLDDTAQVYSKPHLQIYSDDLIASHGSAVGALDEEALFYLQSRGLTIEAAYTVLIDAFASEMLEGIKDLELIAMLKKVIGIDHGA